MASVVEAYEEVIMDQAAFLKLGLLVVPVFFCYELYASGQMTLFYTLLGVTIYLLFIFMLCIINNVRNGYNYVLPKLNMVQFLSFSFKSLFGIIPFIVCMSFIAYFISNLEFAQIPEIRGFVLFLDWGIFGPIMLLAALLFAKTGKPSSVLNISVIGRYCFDIALQTIVVLIQMLFFNAIVLGIIGYVIWVFLSLTHPLFIAIASIAVVVNVAALANCLAQIEYEVVPKEEKESII